MVFRPVLSVDVLPLLYLVEAPTRKVKVRGFSEDPLRQPTKHCFTRVDKVEGLLNRPGEQVAFSRRRNIVMLA